MDQDITHRVVQRNYAAGVAFAFNAASQIHAGIEWLIELNMQALTTSIGELQVLYNAALSSRSPGEVIELQTQIVPATIRKQHAYWRHVGDIAMQTQGNIVRSLRDFTEHVSAPSFESNEVPREELALVSPDERTSTRYGRTAAGGAAPVSIVDSSGCAM